MNTSHQRNIVTVELALAIADATVRSDIELYAFGYSHGDHPWYCLDRPASTYPAEPDPDADQQALEVVDRAFRYIELRGDVFPWAVEQMTNDDGHRCVRFVNLERDHD